MKSALPSAIMRTLPPAFWSRPQAPITNASLTETHQISSTPLRLELVGVADVARHVLGRAGRREGAGQAEDRDLLALRVRDLERVRADRAAVALDLDFHSSARRRPRPGRDRRHSADDLCGCWRRKAQTYSHVLGSTSPPPAGLRARLLLTPPRECPGAGAVSAVRAEAERLRRESRVRPRTGSAYCERHARRGTASVKRGQTRVRHRSVAERRGARLEHTVGHRRHPPPAARRARPSRCAAAAPRYSSGTGPTRRPLQASIHQTSVSGSNSSPHTPVGAHRGRQRHGTAPAKSAD